jgi:ATP-dependent Clp protease ATP-binding subunit ClpB
LVFDPHYGARPIKRVIQKEVLNPIALAIVSNIGKGEKQVMLDVKKRRIGFRNERNCKKQTDRQR